MDWRFPHTPFLLRPLEIVRALSLLSLHEDEPKDVFYQAIYLRKLTAYGSAAVPLVLPGEDRQAPVRQVHPVGSIGEQALANRPAMCQSVRHRLQRDRIGRTDESGDAAHVSRTRRDARCDRCGRPAWPATRGRCD